MKKIKLHIIAIFVLISGGCSLLDVDNPSYIYGDGFWVSKSSVESYLAGTYTSFRSCMNTTGWFEERSDAFVPGLEAGSSDRWAQNLSATNGISWGPFYTVIQHCNMIIKNAYKIDFQQESDRSNLVAQAYAMRSYTFFCLTRLWGAVPLELEPTESSTKKKLPRSPAEKVVEQALSDADKAISLFSSDSWNGNKSLASKPATYALKADILLWKAKVQGDDSCYDDVIICADKALENTSLEPNFRDIFDTRNGNEVIWSIHFGYPEMTGQYSYSLKPRDIFVTSAVNAGEIPYAKSGARSSFAPSEEMIALLNTYPRDVRKDASYIIAYDESGNEIGVFDNKMRGTETETNRIFDNDIILYRAAEMILFKAEAYAAQNKIAEAIAELNKIKSRAGISAYSGASDRASVEYEILDERAREFWLESKRWPDLLRFHYEGLIDIYSVVPNLKRKADFGVKVPLYFAITVSEMSLNHELKQTEGY